MAELGFLDTDFSNNDYDILYLPSSFHSSIPHSISQTSCQPPKHRFFIPIQLNLSLLPWAFAWVKAASQAPMYTLVLLYMVLSGNFLWDVIHQLLQQRKATYLPRGLLSSCCKSMEMLHWAEEESLKRSARSKAGNLYSLHSKGFLCYFFSSVQQATCLVDLPKGLGGIYVIQFGQNLPPWLELLGELSQFWLIFSSPKSLSSKQTLQKYSCRSSWNSKLVLFFWSACSQSEKECQYFPFPQPV